MSKVSCGLRKKRKKRKVRKMEEEWADARGFRHSGTMVQSR